MDDKKVAKKAGNKKLLADLRNTARAGNRALARVLLIKRINCSTVGVVGAGQKQFQSGTEKTGSASATGPTTCGWHHQVSDTNSHTRRGSHWLLIGLDDQRKVGNFLRPARPAM
jgi:hypothetical protein